MNKYNIGMLLLIIVTGVVSCKSKKGTTTAPVTTGKAKEVTKLASANATLLKAIDVNQNTFNYYNSRGTAAYKDAEQSYDLNVEIIMEKDKYVYLNVTAFLGIAVARVWITNDSVSILDILHKKHIVTDYNYIRQMTNVALNLQQVQNIFTGNAIYTTDEQSISADSILSYILINAQIAPQQQQTTYYNSTTLKVTRSIISTKQNQRELRVEYTENYNSGANSYPKEFNINIRAEKNVECSFALNYFAFEKKKETKFVVPQGFKTIRM